MILLRIKNKIKRLFFKEKTYDYYHKNTFWNDHYLIREYLNKLSTGNKKVDWMVHLKNNYFRKKSNLKMLSVVCGNGWQDRDLDKIFNFDRIDGFDISKKLLAEAKNKSNNSKYHYHQGNLNKDKIKLLNYDLAVNLAGLHHIDNMDHLINEIYKSLKTGGIFVNYDYIGPKRNQYSDLDLKYMNLMQKKFPNNLVGRIPITRPDIQTMLKEDPSEAIGSEKIIPTLKKYFHISYMKYLNGGMLYQVLYNQIQNFNINNPKHNQILLKNIELEKKLTKAKKIKPLFAYIVCEKK